jgi:hypothetical protein
MASVINVFKESIDIAKKNYLKLLGLYLIILIIFTVLEALAVLLTAGAALGAVSGISSPLTFIPLVLIVFIAAILISPIWNGIYYSLAIQGMKKSSKTTLDKAFGDSKKVYRKMLWTSVIQTVIMVIILGIILTPDILYILSIRSGSSAFSHPLLFLSTLGITALVFIVVAFILGALFFVAVPLAMLDGSSGIGAIRKSFTVARKYFWSVMGLLILSGIAYAIVYAITEIFTLGFSVVNPTLGEVVSLVLTVLLESFIVGIVGFLPVIFYKRFVKS